VRTMICEGCRKVEETRDRRTTFCAECRAKRSHAGSHESIKKPIDFSAKQTDAVDFWAKFDYGLVERILKRKGLPLWGDRPKQVVRLEGQKRSKEGPKYYYLPKEFK